MVTATYIASEERYHVTAYGIIIGYASDRSGKLVYRPRNDPHGRGERTFSSVAELEAAL